MPQQQEVYRSTTWHKHLRSWLDGYAFKYLGSNKPDSEEDAARAKGVLDPLHFRLGPYSSEHFSGADDAWPLLQDIRGFRGTHREGLDSLWTQNALETRHHEWRRAFAGNFAYLFDVAWLRVLGDELAAKFVWI